jgi:hypothetical protein
LTKQVEQASTVAKQMTTKYTEVKNIVKDWKKKIAMAGNLKQKQQLELALARYMLGPRVDPAKPIPPPAQAAPRGKVGGVHQADHDEDDEDEV